MRFNIIIAVWGTTYVSSLCKIALPSLVPSADAPLCADDRWKFLFFVRENHEREIARCTSRLFPTMEMVFHRIRPEDFANQYLAMAQAHYLGAKLSQADGARGVVVPPDAVFSANALSTLAALAKSGKRAVMTVGPRLREATAVEPLETLLGEAPHIPPRRLAALAAEHLHPEMKRYFWTSENFSTRPFVCYWDAPGGWLCRNFHLHPLMFDFSRTAETAILERDTIDGEFLGETVGVWDDIHVIQDSDELLVLTLTPDGVYYSPDGGEPASAALIRRTAYEDGIVNPLHRWFFTKAIKIHAGDVDDTWRALEEETGRLTFQALSIRKPPDPPPTVQDCKDEESDADAAKSGLIAKFLAKATGFRRR